MTCKPAFTRYRKQSDEVFPPFRRKSTQTFWDGRTPVTSYGPYSPELESFEEMTDVVTPCYKEKVAKGLIINNPMRSTSISHFLTTSGFVDTYYTRYPNGQLMDTFTFENVCYPLQEPVMFGVPSCKTGVSQDIAVNAAYADVSGSIAMALVDLAEAHKTMQMFGMILNDARRMRTRSLMWLKGDSAKRAYARYSRDMKTLGGINRRVGGVVSGASSYWLQWRYGWNPLLMSIADTAEAATAKTGKNLRFTGRGSHSDSNSASAVHHHFTNPLWWAGTTPIPFGDATTTIDLQERIRAGVIAEITLTRAHALGLSILDVPSAAWELIPYSFVVDWFIKVGDWIQAWAPQLDFKILTAWSVLESEKVITRDMNIFARSQSKGTGTYLVRMTGSASNHQYVVVQRDKVRTVNPSRSSLPPIDVNPFTSYRRVLDAIALGYQTFGKNTGARPKRR